MSQISDATTAKRMKIDQYCQRQRCKNVELQQFWHAFASRGFDSDSWAFLYWEARVHGVGLVMLLRVSLNGLSVRVPGYQKLQMTIWHRMLYSCTHTATVGVKGLSGIDVVASPSTLRQFVLR